MLYVVSTPIGNMGDISIRAINILKEVDYIACEDTRHSRKLLVKHGINKPLKAFHEHNESERIHDIIHDLTHELTPADGGVSRERNIALISDSGTPTISDPGYKLIRECIRNKIAVVPIPGPSALITALSVSGLPTDRFAFYGFPPKKVGKKTTFFEQIKSSAKEKHITNILYESPHKLLKTIRMILDIFGDVEMCVCAELTKLHERHYRGRASEVLEQLEKEKIRGEFVVLFVSD